MSRSSVRLAELVRTLEAHGIELVSASESPRLAALARQLDELIGASDEEAAG